MVGRSDAFFDLAVHYVLKHEGGYTQNPLDPGGETKYGISNKSYPTLDIARLTEDQAIEIYRRDFWDHMFLGYIENMVVAVKVFDYAVNVGPRAAAWAMQRAISDIRDKMSQPPAEVTTCEIDGICGSATIAAVNVVDPDRFMISFLGQAYRYYLALANQTYMRGWMTRLFDQPLLEEGRI